MHAAPADDVAVEMDGDANGSYQLLSDMGTEAACAPVSSTKARMDVEGRLPLDRYTSQIVDLSRRQWEFYCRREEQCLAPDRPNPRPSSSATRARSICGLPVIYSNRRAYTIWASLMVAVDMLYTTFLLPFIIAFKRPLYMGYSWWLVEVLIGPLFLVDLLLGFHTARSVRYRTHHAVIEDGRLMAHFYICHGTFAVDLLAVVPWLMVLAYSHHPHQPGLLVGALVMALRLARIWRVVHFFESFFQGSFLAGMSGHMPFGTRSMYMVALTFVAAALVNSMGCFLFLVARIEGLPNSWVAHVQGDNMVHAGAAPLWVAACYWTMTTVSTVGFGDIVAVTTAERVAIMVVQLAGATFFGFVIGTLADILSEAGNEGRRYRIYVKKMHAVDQCLTRLPKLPASLQSRIYSYYADTWVRQQEEEELWTGALQGLPSNLRASVALCLVLPTLQGWDPFMRLPPGQLRQFVVLLQPMSVGPDHEVAQQADEADSLLLLSEGHVCLGAEGHPEVNVAAPALLGSNVIAALDASADSDVPYRSYTITTSSGCLMWRAERQALQVTTRRVPQLAAALRESLKQGLFADAAGSLAS